MVAGFGFKQKNEKIRGFAEAYIFVADAIISNRQKPSSTLCSLLDIYTQKRTSDIEKNGREFQRGSHEPAGHHTLSQYNGFSSLYAKQLDFAADGDIGPEVMFAMRERWTH